MRSRKWLPMLVFLVVGAVPGPGEGGGLSNTEMFGGFEFNFNNPGARALGMGGSFIGLADDATAVVSNPAGLPILQRPELSAEVKFTRFTNTVEAFSNTPAQGLTDSFKSRDFDDSVTTPSFFSFVFPTERLVVAAFVREPVNFRSTFQTDGVFFTDVGLSRLLPVKSDLRITALNLGAGVGIDATKVHPLLPNLGFSIEFSHGTVKARLERFRVPSFFGPPDFSETNVDNRVLVDGSDIGVGLNAGLLWKPVKDLAVGAVFRRGPRYDMDERQEADCSFAFFRGFCREARTSDFSLKVPDVYGFGISYRLLERLTLAADVVHIRYSQLLKGFRIIFGDSSPRDFELDDSTEIHVGGEYVFFIRKALFALRAGYFFDPDHKIRYTGPVTTTSNKIDRVLFPGGKDVHHYTVGFGVSPLPGFQLDFATNQSSTVREYVVSTVFRF